MRPVVLLLALTGALAVLIATLGPGRPVTGGRALGTTGGRTVLIVVPGLRAADVLATGGLPTAASWVVRGASGTVAVRAATAVTRPADGWATLGAGTRARGPSGTSCQAASGEPASAAPADALRVPFARANDGSRYDADPSSLARALRGVPAASTGSPCARLLVPDDAPVAATVDGALATGARVVAVGEPVLPEGAGREQALRGVQADLQRVDARLQAADVVLLVGGSDGVTGPARLHLAVAAGDGIPVGRLVSATTGRAPYVQLIDVAPTILQRSGRPAPASMSGRAWHAAPDGAHPRSAAHRLADLADTERAARAQDGGRPAFMVVFIGGLVLLGLSLLRGRRPLVTCVVLAALPVWQWLAQLVPWWRWPAALPVLLLAASLATAAAAAAVLRAGSSPPGGPERNVVRLGWTVCGLTAAALTADLLCGGALQLNAVLGNSALIAGRFHGAGNVPAAYLASAALVLAAGAAMLTRRPVLSAAVVGGAAVVLDGAPTFGDDAGGVLALAPAVVLLALIGAGVRVTVRRAVLVVLAGAVPLALFALADYSRPAASRTHLGRFVGQIQDGTAGTVLGRKADAVALGELPAPLRIAIGVAVLGAVVVLLRAGVWRWLRARVADPAYPPGVVGALLLYGLLGTVLNDSGVLVAGAVVGFAMPVLTLVADHTRRGSAAPGGG